MARRAPEGPVKSPVNIVVGALLKRLRERSGRRVDQLASALDVSPAYLSAIEAGTNALPAKSVAGLGSLGVSFVTASALLALVSYLDCRMRNSRVYDYREIQLRAERLIFDSDASAFRPFLEWIVTALQTGETGNEAAGGGVEILETSLTQVSRPQPDDAAPVKVELPASHSKLSPMVEDLLDIASSGLSLLTPHISRFNFTAWEELNAGRMFEVRAYVDDAERFLEDAPDFDWHAMLLNPHRPKLTVVVPGVTRYTEEEISNRFYELIPLYNRSQSQIEGVKKQINFVKLQSKSIESRINRALVYDFSHGQLVQELVWAALGSKLLKQKRFSQFDNVWLYELRSSQWRQQSVARIVGILGAYNDDELSSFGVFLDRDDTQVWWQLIDVLIKRKVGN